MYMGVTGGSSKTSFWDTLSPAGRVGKTDEVAAVVSFLPARIAAGYLAKYMMWTALVLLAECGGSHSVTPV